MECSVDGCGRPAKTAGLCKNHYAQQARKVRPANPVPDDYYERQFGEPPTRGGLFAAHVGRDVRRHKCGRCANPYTGGREDCVNNRRAHG